MITIFDIANAIKYFFTGKTSSDIDTDEIKALSNFKDIYEDITEMNVTALISTKLAMLSTSDSSFALSGDNARSEYLNEVANRLWNKINKIIQQNLGVGGIVAIPRITNGIIDFDIVTQDRLIIVEKVSDKITKSAILAETEKINNVTYQRWICHIVENNVITISTRTLSNGKEVILEKWVENDIIIPNVDRCLFSFIKSPVDNRKENDDYGVPITYGAETLIKRFINNIKETDEEFESKKGLTYVDERAFEIDLKTGNPVTGKKTIRAVAGNGDDFIYVDHSPEFRIDGYTKRDNELARKIEQVINLSAGMLSTPTETAKTATEVELSKAETSAMIEKIQASISTFVDEFIYACNILANAFNLAPMGEYEITYDFGTPFKDMGADWLRKVQLHDMGGEPLTALRQFEYPNEDIEQSQAIIDEIKASEPSLSQSLRNLQI